MRAGIALLLALAACGEDDQALPRDAAGWLDCSGGGPVLDRNLGEGVQSYGALLCAGFRPPPGVTAVTTSGGCGETKDGRVEILQSRPETYMCCVVPTQAARSICIPIDPLY